MSTDVHFVSVRCTCGVLVVYLWCTCGVLVVVFLCSGLAATGVGVDGDDTGKVVRRECSKGVFHVHVAIDVDANDECGHVCGFVAEGVAGGLGGGGGGGR